MSVKLTDMLSSFFFCHHQCAGVTFGSVLRNYSWLARGIIWCIGIQTRASGMQEKHLTHKLSLLTSLCYNNAQGPESLKQKTISSDKVMYERSPEEQEGLL